MASALHAIAASDPPLVGCRQHCAPYYLKLVQQPSSTSEQDRSNQWKSMNTGRICSNRFRLEAGSSGYGRDNAGALLPMQAASDIQVTLLTPRRRATMQLIRR
jgi:hypothetical protein